MTFFRTVTDAELAAVREAIAAEAAASTRPARPMAVARAAPPRETPEALVVYDPAWGAGRVTGLTDELRPIVTWDNGQVRSRDWAGLTLGEWRAW